LTLLTGIQANDDGVDFFSRTGTDHHFHFGYWVVAAAAVAAEDLAWYQNNLATYINTLIRDYANNDKNDVLFPYARHKDW
jgi:endo-1,3(4)-beta-glucanase